MKQLFIFSAAPLQRSAFKDFFGRTDIRRLMEQPETLRYAGWNLETRDRVRLGQGQCLELGKKEYKLIQFFEDGTLLVRVPGDASYLGWGRDETGPTRLNPIALAEFTYSFVRFYQSLALLFETAPQAVRCGIRIEKAWAGDDGQEKMYLTPYGVRSLDWEFGRDKHEAPEATMSVKVDAPLAQLRERPERVAFQLLELLYLWFQFTTDKIPYQGEQDGERVIDIEKIKASK